MLALWQGFLQIIGIVFALVLINVAGKLLFMPLFHYDGLFLEFPKSVLFFVCLLAFFYFKNSSFIPFNTIIQCLKSE